MWSKSIRPAAGRCELRKICPTGQARAASDKTAAKAATKGKPAAAPPEVLLKTSKPVEPKPAPVLKAAAITKGSPAVKVVVDASKSVEKAKPTTLDPKANKALPETKPVKGRRPTSK